MNAYLKLDHIDKYFDKGGSRAEVLKGINLTIGKGEFVSVIGHSGCGKSTMLNLIAGLTKVSAGVVLLENREVNEPGPERAVVFQNHSLLPGFRFMKTSTWPSRRSSAVPRPKRNATTGSCAIWISCRWPMPRTRNRLKFPVA